ncbi:hypothetical protein BJ322DRAFT_236727 [Thelephora terrestris]|uniref:BTB domain-containing protein n=1 Tax=Thelephora terrestris TaxID=56493 RepID=A0A9P6L402_9AGAM|nr:hypothetical protein BJ322DRAFT_236727 [Thelephora terrestris]
MPSTSFFTTHDGDVILRTTQEPTTTHDFRVHKFILSLASSVFKDMFTLPEPPDQTHTEPPVVNVPDSPEVIDIILRFIYPGVEPPRIPDVSTLAALFSTADKYNITSINPVLKESMKSFLPHDSFEVYVIACRFGLLEEAKEAARVSTTSSILRGDHSEAVQHISSPDLYRYFRFVQERESTGRRIIASRLGWYLVPGKSCHHNSDKGEDFYTRLTKVVQEEFTESPCLELKDLLVALDRVPDPPHGCEPPPSPAEWNEDDVGDLPCPLVQTFIRGTLKGVVGQLNGSERSLLNRYFEK